MFCKDFTRGECIRGEFCKFSHDFKPAIPGPPPGATTGQMSEFVAGGFNGPPMGMFPPNGIGRERCGDFTRGICRRGDRCKYSHGGMPAMPPLGTMGTMGMPPLGPMGMQPMGTPMMGPGGGHMGGCPPLGMPPMGLPPSMMGPPGTPHPAMGQGVPGLWGLQSPPQQGCAVWPPLAGRPSDLPVQPRAEIPIDYDDL